MAAGERFVVLGLAPVRSTWFRDVGRWSNEATIPVEFIKCISSPEVVSRIRSGRPFSALLADASAPGMDRDLLELALAAGCAPVIVDHGMVERDWAGLGASAVLPERFDSAGLIAVLNEVAQPIARAERTPAEASTPKSYEVRPGGRTVAVVGSGGVGTSTVAMALAQGLAAVPELRPVLLADMALRSSQAMMHDARDMVPGLTELVESHRLGVPSDAEIAASIFDLPDRGYHLLLGLRHERDWLTISSRALDATWRSVERLYELTIADIDADLAGSEETGSSDIEDRNRLARSAAARSDVVVAVGGGDAWGMHRLVRTVVSVHELGVPVERILPVVNRAARQPRARSEVTSAFAELMRARLAGSVTLANPVFCPYRRQLDTHLRDSTPLPSSLVDPVTSGTRALLRRNDPRSAHEASGPVPVSPGSVGTWSEDH